MIDEDALDVWDHMLPKREGNVTMLVTRNQLRRIKRELDCESAIDIRTIEKKLQAGIQAVDVEANFFSSYHSYREIEERLGVYLTTPQLLVKTEIAAES